MFNPVVKKYKLQLTYFSCYDIEGTINSSDGKTTVLSDVGGSFTTLVESLSIIDRAKAVELLKSVAESSTVSYKHYASLTTEELSTVLKIALSYKHYVLNLFPHGTPSINMLSFTADDIAKRMSEVSKAYGCHLWFVL
jgi:hypothetical protein